MTHYGKIKAFRVPADKNLQGVYMRRVIWVFGTLALLTMLTACGNGLYDDNHAVAAVVQAPTSPAVQPVAAPVLPIPVITQPAPQPGLLCNLWSVPTITQSLASVTGATYVTTWIYFGVFNVPNQNVTDMMPVLPGEYQPQYETWYIFKCAGYLTVGSTGSHVFSVSSDDGSNVYLGGSLLLGNDGQHSVKTVTNDAFVAEGTYPFEIDYFGGPPTMEALVLTMDSNPIPAAAFTH